MTTRRATRAEASACGAVLARALRDDAVVAAVIPGEHRREERLTRSYTASLLTGAFADGEVDVVESADRIIGLAAWERPGHRTGLADRLQQFPRYLRAIGLRHLRTALRTSEVFARHRPSTPHWYLADVAVDPAAAGRGIGSELLRTGLVRVDEEHAAAYLEATTPGSRRLYERFGFVAGAPLGLAPGGYPVAMHRPGRP